MRSWRLLAIAALWIAGGLACQTVTSAVPSGQEGPTEAVATTEGASAGAAPSATASPTAVPTDTPQRCAALGEVEQAPASAQELLVEAGQEFTLTWVLANPGPCEWSPAFELVPVDDAGMASVQAVPLGERVPETGTIELELSGAAPSESGIYPLVFQLQGPAGEPVLFGEEQRAGLSAAVRVVAPGEVVQVEGLRIPPPGCVDLDQLRLSSCERGLVDILYVSDLVAGIHQISPLDGAALRPYGATPPGSVEACGNFAMMEEEVRLREGWVYCFRTAAGRLGWFQLQTASGVLRVDIAVAY